MEMKDMHEGHKHVLMLAIFIVIFLGITALSIFGLPFNDPAAMKALVLSVGVYGPLILMLFQVAQVVVPFIPGLVLHAASGAIYGWFLGAVYNIIGILIGSLMAFWLSRKFGRQFVARFIKEHDLAHFDSMFATRGWMTILIAQLIPIIPSDVVCFAAGLTVVRFRVFALITALTLAIKAPIVSFFGESLFNGTLNFGFVLAAVVILAGVIVYHFRHSVRVYLLKEVRALENTVTNIEQNHSDR
ncbi:MAG: TVP38/TMEM64 family protein [Candidatus Woesearchaeota archaeon]